MAHPLGYQVYDGIKRLWLDESEHAWTPDFFSAASFTSLDLARDVAEREGAHTAYVLAVY